MKETVEVQLLDFGGLVLVGAGVVLVCHWLLASTDRGSGPIRLGVGRPGIGGFGQGAGALRSLRLEACNVLGGQLNSVYQSAW